MSPQCHWPLVTSKLVTWESVNGQRRLQRHPVALLRSLPRRPCWALSCPLPTALLGVLPAGPDSWQQRRRVFLVLGGLAVSWSHAVRAPAPDRLWLTEQPLSEPPQASEPALHGRVASAGDAVTRSQLRPRLFFSFFWFWD